MSRGASAVGQLIDQNFNNAVSVALTGEKTPEQALADAQSAALRAWDQSKAGKKAAGLARRGRTVVTTAHTNSNPDRVASAPAEETSPTRKIQPARDDHRTAVHLALDRGIHYLHDHLDGLEPASIVLQLRPGHQPGDTGRPGELPAAARGPKVLTSLYNTFFYTLLAVPLEMILALALASLLATVRRGSGTFRTVFFLPKMTCGGDRLGLPAAAQRQYRGDQQLPRALRDSSGRSG